MYLAVKNLVEIERAATRGEIMKWSALQAVLTD